jgi:hypothetical protein
MMPSCPDLRTSQAQKAGLERTLTTAVVFWAHLGRELFQLCTEHAARPRHQFHPKAIPGCFVLKGCPMKKASIESPIVFLAKDSRALTTQRDAIEHLSNSFDPILIPVNCNFPSRNVRKTLRSTHNTVNCPRRLSVLREKRGVR